MRIRKSLKTITSLPKLTTLLLLFAFNLAYAGGIDSEKILEEGKMLYRLERASWLATDLFLADYPELRDSVGGYISYEVLGNKVNTIFYSTSNPNDILLTLQFSSLLDISLLTTNDKKHQATKLENDLIAMRLDAVKRVSENKDEFYSFYKNATLNFIPVIGKKYRKVIVITAYNVDGKIALGNDYALHYNKKNKFKKQEKIHNSLLSFPVNSKEEGNKMVSTTHSHVISPIINATDICTLLLYKDFVEWKTHYVLSKDYISIFNLEKETLFVMKREVWEKIMKDQEERHPEE